MNKKQILTSMISTGGYQRFIDQIFHLAEHKRSSYVCFANVHMLIEAYKDPAFNRVVNQADMATPDGAPLSVGLKLLYGKKQDRVAGMDVFPHLLKEAAARKKTVYLFGSTPEVLEAIVKKAQKQIPGINIVGYLSPPFRKLSDKEEADIVQQINEAKPDLLMVALGCPKQEKWAAAHKGKIESCMLAVGGAFNVYAGIQDRAPKWMQRFSLEWLYRLIQEPGRLWKRYLVTNSLFVMLFIKYYIQVKTKSGNPLEAPQ